MFHPHGSTFTLTFFGNSFCGNFSLLLWELGETGATFSVSLLLDHFL